MPKEKRFQTYPNRWGEGKVHRYIYDSENKGWHVACRRLADFSGPHGREVDSTTPPTCKKCGA
jgi:hypothetical protein